MEATNVDHKAPRNRAGGVITDPEKIQLHANDFSWSVKFDELPDDDKDFVQEYVRTLEGRLTLLQDNTEKDHPGLLESNNEGDSWDSHYRVNKRHFPFKNYITLAFPLLRSICSSSQPDQCKYILECGCGTGSTLLPMIEQFQEGVRFIGFDVSPTAVSTFLNHPIAKEASTKGLLTVFSYDISIAHEDLNDEPKKVRLKTEKNANFLKSEIMSKVPSFKGTADAVLLVFVLSSLPSVGAMLQALRTIAKVMDAGSVLFFRDYGIADHNMFRFSRQGNNLLNGLWFRKGDSTLQMFFDLEFVRKLFSLADFEEIEGHALQYHCNRLVNRKNGKKMDKIFINGSFRLISNAL